MDKPIWMWALFLSVVVVLMALDLGVLHKKQREIGVRESLIMSGFYIAIACLFGGWVWYQLGPNSGKEYFTAFFVEKSLSMDNIFVISLVFSFFGIPREYQHRVLFWGILGVIVLRGIMIGVGAALVAEFHWLLYLFGAFLIYTGIKMLFMAEDDGIDLENNRVVRFLRRYLHVTESLHGSRFFVRLPAPDNPNKKLPYATPLFLALVVVEFIDIVFAVDSIPAVFAITTDPYVVYTSNVFAILGLRALYFALAALLHRFKYLKYALSLVLIFIGSKLFINELVGWEKFPPSLSLGVTMGLLGGGVIFSLIKTRGDKPEHS